MPTDLDSTAPSAELEAMIGEAGDPGVKQRTERRRGTPPAEETHPMAARYTTRYGYQELITAGDEESIMKMLVDELAKRIGLHPGVAVSIGNERWSVTAQVSGLITFDNVAMLEGEPSNLPETAHLRDIPDETLFQIWRATISADHERITSFGWKNLDQLPEYTRDFYRAR